MRTTTRTALFIGTTLALPATAVGVSGALGDPPDPTPAAAPKAPPADDAFVAPPNDDMEAADRFRSSGYQVCDAQAIAQSLGVEVWEAKVATGERLLAAEPVEPPSGCSDDTTQSDPAERALTAFWDAGYYTCDAEALAAEFGGDGSGETKVLVGQALLAGEDVPAPLGCSPEPG